jgi:hypothetical protein
MYGSIIQEDIRSFLQLLAKLFKAFDYHIGINSPLNNIGKEVIMTGKKPSNVESSVVC